MAGYTEVIQVMGAMVLFSLILLSTNRYMLSNTHQQVGSEVEMLGVTIAQDLIDEARLREFDAVMLDREIPENIPGSFAESPFPTASVNSRDQIQTFEGYNGWQETIETGLGPYELFSEVHYVSSSDLSELTADKTFHKRMIVMVTHPSLTSPVRIQYLKTYNH
jgi:hypothetical protein